MGHIGSHALLAWLSLGVFAKEVIFLRRRQAGVRIGGKVVYRGWAVPQAIYMDYDVLAACPPALNWSGIGDILCFHTGVLDWRYAEREGKIEEKWRFDENIARQSLKKVRNSSTTSTTSAR